MNEYIRGKPRPALAQQLSMIYCASISISAPEQPYTSNEVYCKYDIKACDDGVLIQLLCFWRSGIGTSSFGWAQLSRFHLRAETESSLRNVMRCFK
jgi:hypothetical protein